MGHGSLELLLREIKYTQYLSHLCSPDQPCETIVIRHRPMCSGIKQSTNSGLLNTQSVMLLNPVSSAIRRRLT